MSVQVPNKFYVAQGQQITVRDAENRNSSCISRERPMPPMGLIDAMADRKLDGGYPLDNMCPECHELRSLNGKCTGCDLGPGNGLREPDTPMRTPDSRIGRRAKQNGLI